MAKIPPGNFLRILNNDANPAKFAYWDFERVYSLNLAPLLWRKKYSEGQSTRDEWKDYIHEIWYFLALKTAYNFWTFVVIFAFKVFIRMWGNNEQTLVAVVDKLSEKSCVWPGNSPTAEHTSAEIGTTSESRNSESEFILMALRSYTGLAVLGTSCKKH